jgi:tRNA-modifying protein YgfZ
MSSSAPFAREAIVRRHRAILEFVATIETSRLDAEYRALTESCGLLDRSARGKLALTGSGAKEFLAGQVTNDIEALSPWSGCYAAFLTPKGKMLGDLRVLDLGDELFLDTERVALQALFDRVRRFKIGYDVELHKRTVECSLLSLIGPTTQTIATRFVAGAITTQRAGDHEVGALVGQDAQGDGASEHDVRALALPGAEHSSVRVEIDGLAVVLARTDVGVDIICDVSDGAAVSEALLSAGAHPVSEQAAEIVRVEHGRPRYGVDLDETVIPQEAGLNERAVSFTKGCYVGQETVARLHYKGKPNRHLRGLRLSAPAEPGAELRLGERSVGRLSSSVLSPRHGPIGLALVRREAEPGATVFVGEHGVSAEVLELPFQARQPFAPGPG